MSSVDIEGLLWKLADRPGTGAESPPDEVLEAYREGRLDDLEAKRLEAQLADSPAGRARLAELAQVDLPSPGPELRQRILDSRPRAREQRPRRWLWPAAAVAAALIAAVLGLPLVQPGSLPTNLEFDVTARGQAAVRDAQSAGEIIEATPETQIRIRLEPQGDAADGVDFGLYRRIGHSARRVMPESALEVKNGLTLKVERGSAVFEGPVSVLTNGRPGLHTVYIVAAGRRDLPLRVRLAPNQEVMDVLAADGRRRVYRRQIRVRDSAEMSQKRRATDDESTPTDPQTEPE